MAQRKKVKECKNLRRCVCGCGRMCNGHDVVRTTCAVNYVKKLGWRLLYPVWAVPLSPSQFKKQFSFQRSSTLEVSNEI